jgi:hypothetical protein
MAVTNRHVCAMHMSMTMCQHFINLKLDNLDLIKKIN